MTSRKIVPFFYQIMNKISRVYRCQLKHLCGRVLGALKPNSFFRNPKLITALWYMSQKGRIPHFSHPRNIDEQLMANNLRAMNNEQERAIRIQCADKYAVREYVRNKGFNHILNNCFGVYRSVDEIDFDDLPDQFVLKLTNGCGQNFICRDKRQLDIASLKKTLHCWIDQAPFIGLKTGEWHYSQIEPRIIAEEYLSFLDDGNSLIDYKFHCFNGNVLGVLVCYDRDPQTHLANYDWYDLEWNLTDGEPEELHKNQRIIPKPASFNEMIKIVKALSSNIEYVRIDLYDINGKPLFGEMTFTEGGNILVYNQWVKDAMFHQLNQSRT